MAGSSTNLYAWPCTVNVANFVSVKPSVEKKGDHNEFRNWREQMVCLLESQDVLGFVDGEIQQPPTEEEKKAWRRTDRLVKGWILGSIGSDALNAVSNKETARDVWLELHTIFIDIEAFDGGDSGSSRYLLTLYKAAQRGDWDTLNNSFQNINELSGTIISSYAETPLHVAVLTGKANSLVNELVKTMPLEALVRKNHLGNTALHNAVIVGNTTAASALVERHPDLLLIPNLNNRLPVILAAVYGKQKTLEYLISQHEPNPSSLFEGQLGVQLLNVVIGSEFTDIAFDLARKYPNLALLRDRDGDSALSIIAGTDNLFPRTETFSWWQSFIYNRIPLKKSTTEADAAHTTCDALDIENLSSNGNSTSFQIIPRGKLS